MINNNKLIFVALLLSVGISTQLLKYTESVIGEKPLGPGLLAYPLSLALSIIISGILMMMIILIINWLQVHDESN